MTREEKIIVMVLAALVLVYWIGLAEHTTNQIARAATLRRFEVVGDGPQSVGVYPAQPKSGIGVLGPGRFGVVAEKCDVDPFVGLVCTGPAADGRPQIIAQWHPQHWVFLRELAEGEPWGEGLRVVMEE